MKRYKVVIYAPGVMNPIVTPRAGCTVWASSERAARRKGLRRLCRVPGPHNNPRAVTVEQLF